MCWGNRVFSSFVIRRTATPKLTRSIPDETELKSPACELLRPRTDSCGFVRSRFTKFATQRWTRSVYSRTHTRSCPGKRPRQDPDWDVLVYGFAPVHCRVVNTFDKNHTLTWTGQLPLRVVIILDSLIWKIGWIRNVIAFSAHWIYASLLVRTKRIGFIPIQ